MKLSTGKVAFPIEFDNGDKETIYFNPSDPDLMVRIKNFNERVSSQIQENEDIELNVDGSPKDGSEIESFEKMQNIFKKEFDYVFGANVSGVVFKHCSPLAIVDGEYFAVQFIQAILPEIKKHIKKANEDVERRMAKHVDKYRK